MPLETVVSCPATPPKVRKASTGGALMQQGGAEVPLSVAVTQVGTVDVYLFKNHPKRAKQKPHVLNTQNSVISKIEN